jgi:Kef-type K+ transport system membrane component KefB
MSTLTVIGVTALGAYYMGRVAQRIHLPSIIGFMIAGVLLGTSGLGILTEETIEHLAFLTEVALGFVAFTIGTELSLSSLKQQGRAITAVILAESFGAFIVVTSAVYVLTRDLPLSLVFGSMAPASAPAGTVAVIQETRAKGRLTTALYAVVGFDDGLAIVIFGFATAIAKSLLSAETSGAAVSVLSGMASASAELGLSILVGGVIGLVYSQLVRFVKDPRDLLILSFGAIVATTGLASTWHMSLILTNMVIGFTFVNIRRSDAVQAVSRQLLGIMPLLFVIFFALAGAHLQLPVLKSLGIVGVVYIVGRSTGLVGGAWLGAVIGKAHERIRKYVGFGILSQAGVAIGLSLLVKHDFAEIGNAHADRIGVCVLATITATCIFFEIVGPILTKVALTKAGEIPNET